MKFVLRAYHLAGRTWAPLATVPVARQGDGILCLSLHRYLLAWLIVAFAAGSGCSGVRLISSYDEATDKSLTAIQQRTGDFIDLLKKKARTEEAAFKKHEKFYEEMDRDLRHLEFRVGAIPKNEKTIRLVKDIRAVILGEGTCSDKDSSLRSLHCLPENRERGPSARLLEINERNISQTISAALNLELAKKQGSD